jgi:hypothetical protein
VVAVDMLKHPPIGSTVAPSTHPDVRGTVTSIYHTMGGELMIAVAFLVAELLPGWPGYDGDHIVLNFPADHDWIVG